MAKLLVWDGTKLLGRNLDEVVSQVSYDYSDSNLPWSYTSTSEWESRIPTGASVVNLQTASGDFYTNLMNTVNAAPGRVIVRLPTGIFSLNQFRQYGSGSNPTYKFCFFFSKLQGFVGAGPDKTFIQLEANSMIQADLDNIAAMDPNDFAPLQMSMMRIDGSAASPAYMGGLTVRAADQQMLTTKHPNLNVYVPQPAPHRGVLLYSDGICHSFLSHVRFQACARAINSQPPFECGNIETGRGVHEWRNIEVDGRRSAYFDAARPRRAGVFLINSEYEHKLIDSWFHHSNVSRYAANDQSHSIAGEYLVERVKADHITDTLNRDPALNGGNSLGGVTNASAFGWESVNGTITVRDCIIEQDGPKTGTGELPMHLQLTSVGGRNPQGGRFYVYGGVYRSVHAAIDGFRTFRISPSTYWWMDGFNTTLFIYGDQGQRLTPYQSTGTWPPTAAALTAAGVTRSTHFIIRSTS